MFNESKIAIIWYFLNLFITVWRKRRTAKKKGIRCECQCDKQLLVIAVSISYCLCNIMFDPWSKKIWRKNNYQKISIGLQIFIISVCVSACLSVSLSVCLSVSLSVCDLHVIIFVLGTYFFAWGIQRIPKHACFF